MGFLPTQNLTFPKRTQTIGCVIEPGAQQLPIKDILCRKWTGVEWSDRSSPSRCGRLVRETRTVGAIPKSLIISPMESETRVLQITELLILSTPARESMRAAQAPSRKGIPFSIGIKHRDSFCTLFTVSRKSFTGS
jgi:hypothetical protein